VKRQEEPELNLTQTPVLRSNPKLVEIKAKYYEAIRPSTGYIDVKTRSALYANI